MMLLMRCGTGLAPAQADIDEGHKRGHEKRPSRDERTGQIWLCRKKRVLAIEAEIVKRVGGYFVGENPIVAHRHHAVAG
jgi:hypothetical protein